MASCHLLWGGAQQPSHTKVLSMGVSLARLHTPHKTLHMRTELTQAKLKPLAKDMQTRNLSLVIRMPPCKNTQMHMHMYVHCLQFQAPTSFSLHTCLCISPIQHGSRDGLAADKGGNVSFLVVQTQNNLLRKSAGFPQKKTFADPKLTALVAPLKAGKSIS